MQVTAGLSRDFDFTGQAPVELPYIGHKGMVCLGNLKLKRWGFKTGISIPRGKFEECLARRDLWLEAEGGQGAVCRDFLFLEARFVLTGPNLNPIFLSSQKNERAISI